MRHSLARWLHLGLFVSVMCGVLITGWVIVLTIDNALFFHRTGLSPPLGSNIFRMAVKEVVSTILKPYYDSRLISTTTLPVYDLELSAKRLKEWHRILTRVSERGRSNPDDQYYIPAKFRAEGYSQNVAIRARGVFSDHYQVAKPSFRIKFPKQAYFRGNRVINLIVPYDKGLVGDIGFNAVARQYGILTYPTDFAVVRLNGTVLGVYQEVAHFRKELAVKQNRSEGYFFNGAGEGKGGADDIEDELAKAALQAIMTCWNDCDVKEVRKLLDTYIDEEKMAAFTALTTLFASSHAWGTDNLMLFFDPARGRFEPVPWDVAILPLQPQKPYETVTGLGEHLLRDAQFRHRRNQILWDVLSRKIDFLIQETDKQFAALRPSLDYDVEHSRVYTLRTVKSFKTYIKENAAFLKQQLTTNSLSLTVGSDGFLFTNRAAASVYVDSVTLTDGSGRSLVIAIGKSIPGKFEQHEVRRFVKGAAQYRPDDVEIDAHNRITQVKVSHDEYIWEWHTRSVAPPETVYTSPSPPPEHGIVAKLIHGELVWSFGGSVRLKQSLVIPKGVKVVFEPGMELSLDPGVNLVVQGDLKSIGTPRHPIVIRATDPKHPFGTLAISGRSDHLVSVIFDYTTIDGGSEGDFNSVHFSGTLSVHDSALDMNHTQLLRSKGEDALNVKYGRVKIHNSFFENSAADAVDLDFCTGTLANNHIVHSGGDGFDISGSVLEIDNNFFFDLGDKGISVGEKSTVSLSNNIIHRAVTGIAVKDQSVATLRTNTLSDLNVGVAIYQKKQAFGSGSVEYHSGIFEDVDTAFLTDPKAKLNNLSPNHQ